MCLCVHEQVDFRTKVPNDSKAVRTTTGMGLLPWKLIAAKVLETVCICRGQSANYQTDYNQLCAGTETADGRETSRAFICP